MKNPVILIEATSMTKRNIAMDIVMREGNLENYDASGNRAVVWSEDTNTIHGRFFEERLRRIVRELKPQTEFGSGIKLSVIEDPGLGIILPGDLEK